MGCPLCLRMKRLLLDRSVLVTGGLAWTEEPTEAGGDLDEPSQVLLATGHHARAVSDFFEGLESLLQTTGKVVLVVARQLHSVLVLYDHCTEDNECGTESFLG